MKKFKIGLIVVPVALSSVLLISMAGRASENIYPIVFQNP